MPPSHEPLLAELDLRPFRKLVSLLGMLRCTPEELPAVLRRMPRRLESLCLTAENLPEPRDFDAGGCGLLLLQRRALRACSAQLGMGGAVGEERP